LDSKQDLQAMAFSDSDIAWLIGENKLFQSKDHGEQWNAASIPISNGSTITAVFFLKRTIGWIAIDKSAQEGIETRHHLEIYRTDDSGNSWQKQYEADNAVVWSMRFLSEDEGWLVGTKYMNPSPFAPMVLHTSTGGNKWLDVSEGVRLTLDKSKTVFVSSQDHAVELIEVTPRSAILATSRMHMLSTEDDGRLWNQIVHLAAPAHIGLRDSGVWDKRYWLVGATMGEEGVGSVFARQQADGDWTEYKIPGVYIKHVYFVDDKSILACGSIVTSNPGNSNRGVILVSPDGGTTWMDVYEDSQSGLFNFIGSDVDGRIWVAGDNGSVLRLASAATIVSDVKPR
jgi:photosystem II stability/assembly factor-like uncharacterized protein